MKRVSNIAFLCAVLLLIVLIPVTSLLGHREQTSYYEQRTLARFPSPSLETISNGAFFADLETYAADHIVGRDYLLKTDTAINMLLQRPNVNDLLVNTDVLLNTHGFSRWGLGYVTDDAARVASDYAALQREINTYGGYFCYLGVPLQSTYFASSYPSYMDNRLWHTETIREAFSEAMASEAVPFIDMHAQYEQMGFPKEFYYETDHHFSLKGAFAAYQVLMQHLQSEKQIRNAYLDEDAFVWETLPNPFLGSANRKLYGLWQSKDSVEIAYPKKEVDFIRTDLGQQYAEIFSLPENTQNTVTYSVYMGGDIGETIIQTKRSDLPNVLIYGDSFTNAIETVLWTNFNETRCLDFRYYTEMSLMEYLKEFQPDIVICVRDEMNYLSSLGNGTTK